MIKYIIITILCFFIFNSCGSTCDDVKKYSKSLECFFKVTEKSKKKFIKFKGLDRNNSFVEFEVSEFWDIYDSVEIGDTLQKELGKTELILIKKDTTLSFPLMCKGIIVE